MDDVGQTVAILQSWITLIQDQSYRYEQSVLDIKAIASTQVESRHDFKVLVQTDCLEDLSEND